jgi:hypothetical protein
MRGPARKRVLATLLGGVAALLVFASFAAAETDRAGYVAAVEPICKSNRKASDRILKPVKNLVKKDKLKQAGQAFAKGARELQKTQKLLAAVEKPPADSAKLSKWLSEVKAEVALMKTISVKFKKEKKGPATTLVNKLTKKATHTNNLVIAFQFNYCKIDPSKYT